MNEQIETANINEQAANMIQQLVDWIENNKATVESMAKKVSSGECDKLMLNEEEITISELEPKKAFYLGAIMGIVAFENIPVEINRPEH